MFKVSNATVNWLLESNGSHAIQPVVYLTLTKILHKTHRSKQVKEAWSRINEYSSIKKILNKAPIFWRPGEFLFQKYEGGFWQLSFLADLHANPEHPEIKRGLEFILDRSDDDGFYGVHCLSANIYRAMMQFGYERDERVLRGFEYQCQRIIEHSGADCYVMDYSLLPTCHMTLPKILFAMSYVPEDLVTPVMTRAKNILIREMRETKIYVYVPGNSEKFKQKVEELTNAVPVNKRGVIREEILELKARYLKSPGLGKRLGKTEWFKFGFPNSYNTDILEVMLSLASVGVRKHKEFTKALDIIKDKMQTDTTGRQYWIMESSLNDEMIAPVEEKGKPSKWLTLNALQVIEHFEGLKIES